MFEWIKRYGLLASATIAAFLLTFSVGISLGIMDKPPARHVAAVIGELKDLKKNWKAYFADTPTQHLRLRAHAGDGVIVSNPEQMQPGVTFVSGLFGDVLGFRLYAADGALLYEWPINFFNVAPDEMKHKFHALIHGSHLYENGDVVANLDGRGVVRFDVCGNILWRSSDKSHHSVFIDDAGAIWTPTLAGKQHDPVYTPLPFMFDSVAEFDPATGRKLSEFNLYEVLVKSDMFGLAQRHADQFADVFHLNDVEVLSSEMAAAFPMFKAGDILLSSRNLHQLWVVDGQDHTLKWSFGGPMLGQHDPDFQPNGKISVLDNRVSVLASGENGFLGNRGGSRILEIDPATRNWTTIYRTDEKNNFYTQYRGKHQLLENGNILIAETDAGRAFEVAPDGSVVWSFVNGWDETRSAWLVGANRYPPSYGKIASPTCN